MDRRGNLCPEAEETGGWNLADVRRWDRVPHMKVRTELCISQRTANDFTFYSTRSSACQLRKAKSNLAMHTGLRLQKNHLQERGAPMALLCRTVKIIFLKCGTLNMKS
jgi:hypothetical protein